MGPGGVSCFRELPAVADRPRPPRAGFPKAIPMWSSLARAVQTRRHCRPAPFRFRSCARSNFFGGLSDFDHRGSAVEMKRERERPDARNDDRRQPAETVVARPPQMLWAPWRVIEGGALAEAKRDATILMVKLQEDAGIDIVTDGEQARQHFVHGFLEHIEGVDFSRRVTWASATTATRRRCRPSPGHCGAAEASTASRRRLPASIRDECLNSPCQAR